MARGVQQLNARQIEDNLNRVRDVYAARVILNDAKDEIEEIHVLASQARSAKQIVRDIESLLLVKFHTRVDYRRVSLVQLSAQDLLSYFRRPKLVSVRQDANGQLAVEVCLAYGDGAKAIGRAQEQPNAQDACHVAALAAIEALSGIFGNTHELVLKKATVVPCDGRSVALVHLLRQTDHGVEHLLGASFADPDVVHGAVRATLDALNRRFF